MKAGPVNKSKTASAAPAPPAAAPSAAPSAVAADSKSGYMSYLMNAWVFIPAIVYFMAVSRYAVNFPYQDDYNAILEFLTKYKAASGMDKFFLLFSQHGDHRIFHSRLVYVIYYDLFGKVNFRSIIFLGNLQLVVIFTIMLSFIKRAIPKYWNIFGLILGFCIFDLSSYENADFAMSGLQNYGVIMLFMLSLYFFAKQGNKLVWAAAFCEVTCIFSSGNGMICAFILTLFLLVTKERLKMIVSGIVLVVCASLYYFHYTKDVVAGAPAASFDIMRIIRFFFLMMGNHFANGNGVDMGIPIGIAIMIALPLLVPFTKKEGFKTSMLPLLYIGLTLLATVGVIAIFRSAPPMDEKTAYSSRYLIYAHMVVGLLPILIWSKFDGKKMGAYIIAGLAIALVAGYKVNYQYGEACMEMTKRRLEGSPYFYGSHNAASNEIAKKIEADACAAGIYCIKDER